MDNNLTQRFWGMLSLSMKAGALAVGEGRAQDAIRRGATGLIILSSDASDNTSKKFLDMGRYRDIAVIRVSDRKTLGSAIGKDFAVAIAVTDEGFSKKLLELFENKTK